MRRLQPDCGVIGEGERAFPEVLTRLETGHSLEGIDGVVTAAKGNGSGAVLARAEPSSGWANCRRQPTTCAATRVTSGAAGLWACKPSAAVRSNAPIAFIRNWKAGATGCVRRKPWSRKSKPWPPGRRCGISFSWTASSTIPGATRWPFAGNFGGGNCRSAGRPFAIRSVSTRNSRAP